MINIVASWIVVISYVLILIAIIINSIKNHDKPKNRLPNQDNTSITPGNIE
jgi:hypothetical protein